jgi:hypothetical protein
MPTHRAGVLGAVHSSARQSCTFATAWERLRHSPQPASGQGVQLGLTQQDVDRIQETGLLMTPGLAALCCAIAGDADMIPQYKNIKMFYPEQHAYTFDQYRWGEWLTQQGVCCGSSRSGCLLHSGGAWQTMRCRKGRHLGCLAMPAAATAPTGSEAPLWASSSSAPTTAFTAL